MEHISPAWQACIEHWLQKIKDHSGSKESFVNYTSIIRRFVAFVQKPLDQVTRADVMSFMALPSTGQRTPGQPVSASTRNGKLSAIQSLFAFASSYEVTQADGSLAPLWLKALPTVGLSSQKKNVRARQMSQEELARFFAAIDPTTRRGKRDKVLYYCYLILGRRRAELLRLRWGDLQPAFIDGRQSVVYEYIGKGDSRRVRQKEMPPDVYAAICDLLRQEGRLDHMQAGDYIFRSSHAPGHPLSADGVGYQFHLYALKAGLAPHITLHSLRWSSAYHRAMSGSSVTDVRDILDHSDLSITSRYLSGMISQHDAGADALARQFAFLR